MRKSLIAMLMVAWSSPCAAAGAVIHVPADQPTIQAGINAARDGDEVVIADGVYSGTGNFNLNYHGKAITVRSAKGPEHCTIDCQGSPDQFRRAVIFKSGEGPASVLEGLTIRRGAVPTDLGPFDGGGAIVCDDASPTIRHCIFEENQAGNGGAIFCGSQTKIESCVFRNNQAALGGALAAHNASRIVGCSFEGNIALLGGAALLVGPVTLSDSRVVGNVGGSGAAILINEDGAIVTGCLIAGNIGEALRAEFAAVTIANCTIADHISGHGIILLGGSADVSNCIISDCLLGSIALANGATATVTHSLVAAGWPGEGNIDADPQFISSFFDNPLSHLYRVQPTSPCIDAGSNALVPVSLTTDLDGYPRILDGDVPPDGIATVDMGCYEFVRSRKQLP